MKKSIIYYTDNQLDPDIMTACQRQLKQAQLPVVSVSLKPINFGQNIVLNLKPSIATMFKQILTGLEANNTDVVFFCEHDVLYHKSHFKFMPAYEDIYYYNVNVWKVRSKDGHALKVNDCKQTSGLCAYRSLVLKHYRQRATIVERNGFTYRMGFEPGTHSRIERIDDYKAKMWMSEQPNIDIRHPNTLTSNRWRKDQFRNQRYTQGWTEADEVPGWGRTKGRFEEMLNGILGGSNGLSKLSSLRK